MRWRGGGGEKFVRLEHIYAVESGSYQRLKVTENQAGSGDAATDNNRERLRFKHQLRLSRA